MNRTPSDEKSPRSYTLLVVDDESGLRETFRLLFNYEYRVICAESVDVAIEHLEREGADAIIMDYNMPGKNGLEGLREIRELDPKVPVIMLTAYASIETSEAAKEAGANACMKKPFSLIDIRSAVRDYMTESNLLREREANARQLDPQLN